MGEDSRLGFIRNYFAGLFFDLYIKFSPYKDFDDYSRSVISLELVESDGKFAVQVVKDWVKRLERVYPEDAEALRRKVKTLFSEV